MSPQEREEREQRLKMMDLALVAIQMKGPPERLARITRKQQIMLGIYFGLSFAFCIDVWF